MLHGGIMVKNDFAAKLRLLRTNAGLTMEQLSIDLDTTKSSINMWENGGVIPRNKILKKISQRFEVSIDYLLGNDDQEGKTPDNETLVYLQRNLEKLDEQRLKKAEDILKAVFDDIFDDEEDHGNI